jgi:glucose/mannose-6-phosphate isomerase
VSLPDGAGRAGALLRGAAPAPSEEDFFRDRVDEGGVPQRARLLVIGDDGAADDASLGERSGAQIQLDEIAARRAAARLRQLADELGVRASSVDVPDAPPLARFASAAAFGEFTAAYLGFALGFDPGTPRPAEMGH